MCKTYTPSYFEEISARLQHVIKSQHEWLDKNDYDREIVSFHSDPYNIMTFDIVDAMYTLPIEK